MTLTVEDERTLVLLRAIGEPNRLRLFRALQVKERCVSDLVTTEQLSQPLVSHHLGVLVTSGLVRARRHDGFTLYAIDPEGLEAARAAVSELLDAAVLRPVALPGGNPACCRDGRWPS